MTDQHQDRRIYQRISYDAIVDRRAKSGAPRKLQWPDDGVVPGMIRPGVNDQWDGVERRRFPDSGEE
jgi:hypothetical protein